MKRTKSKHGPLTSTCAQGEFVARADCRIGGIQYERGGRVDVSGISAAKLAQLLTHRIILDPTEA